MKKILIAVALTIAPAIASAQQFCANPTHSTTSIGLSAGAVPASALAGRGVIVVCNSAENANSPVVKCRADGTNPVIGVGNVGDVLQKGQCVPYAIGSGTAIKCIADTAATAVTALECKGAGVIAPLPTSAPSSATVTVSGVATAAKQDTGNTSLATIATNLPAKGQATKANSLPVTTASDGVIESLVGLMGTPVAISVTSGADATANVTGGVRYVGISTAGVYAFCKPGGTATLETDVPFAPDQYVPVTWGNTADGTIALHCVLRSSVTGKVLFIPMTPKL